MTKFDFIINEKFCYLVDNKIIFFNSLKVIQISACAKWICAFL